MTGSVASASPGRATSPSMSRPSTKKPAFWNASSERVRLGTRATDASGGPGRRLPRTGRHAGRTTLGQHDPVTAERRDGADHRAEVARVGDAVERDDQRNTGRLRVDEVRGVDIGVGEPGRRVPGAPRRR